MFFSRLGELRSLCRNSQLLALTATAGPTQRRKIMKSLCFKPQHKVILESPDRENIKITPLCIPSNQELEVTFKFLLKELHVKKESLPRHVIFCESILNVSKIYSLFVKEFGRSSKLFNMYHSKTSDKVKENIREDMTTSGNIRVLICTNSAGMGVNFHGVNNIIHYGIPREMDTFVQQMGRAGRDGQYGEELIIFSAHKGQLGRVEVDLVKLVKDDSECRHTTLCLSYALDNKKIVPLHNCCDFCEKLCKCGDDICPRSRVALIKDNVDEEEEVMEREVNEDDKKILRHQLYALKYSLTDSDSLISSEIIHGLTDAVIEQLVCCCQTLFTAEDVMKNCSIWSFTIAEQIMSVIENIFGDAEMYTFEENLSGEEIDL